MSRLRSILTAAVAVLSAVAVSPATAQKYPSRPITLVCPFAPGGSADIMARLLARALSDATGQSVIVENKAGLGSTLGSAYAAKQKPDGYTLLLITGAYPVQAAMLKSLPFDPITDIAMVSLVTSYPFVLTVLPSSPIRSLADLIAQAKANPGKLNYSSSGIGSVHHLSSELFNSMAGTEMVHIPLKGGSGPLTELMAGRVDALFEATTLTLPYIKSGKLRALAVTSRERAKSLPEVPPVHDTLPGYEVISFIGLGATGGTPAPIIGQLNAEVRRIVEAPDDYKRLVELGGEPRASSAEEMKSFVEREIGKWKAVVESRKIERQ